MFFFKSFKKEAEKNTLKREQNGGIRRDNKLQRHIINKDHLNDSKSKVLLFFAMDTLDCIHTQAGFNEKKRIIFFHKWSCL